MSIQAAHLIHGQASASPENLRDEAVYTFTGALNGAGREFSFNLFGLAQGAEDAGAILRAAAQQLLREIYLPLLPWDATNRPDALDALAAVLTAPQKTLTGMALAVIVDHRAYMGWQGDGRVYVLADMSIEQFDFEGAEPVASQVVSPGMSLLLCTGGLWRNLSDHDILRAVEQTQSIQSACDQLVKQALLHDGDSRPFVVLIHRPA